MSVVLLERGAGDPSANDKAKREAGDSGGATKGERAKNGGGGGSTGRTHKTVRYSLQQEVEVLDLVNKGIRYQTTGEGIQLRREVGEGRCEQEG